MGIIIIDLYIRYINEIIAWWFLSNYYMFSFYVSSERKSHTYYPRIHAGDCVVWCDDSVQTHTHTRTHTLSEGSIYSWTADSAGTLSVTYPQAVDPTSSSYSRRRRRRRRRREI